MPWSPLPRIAFAICTYPYVPSEPTDLPLQIGDELYIIEQGGKEGAWYRGYLVAPPSLLSGLTSSRGQALEARVFSGIFPRECIEIRELLGDVTAFANGAAAKDADKARKPGPRPPAPVPMLKIGDESVFGKDEPLVDEIASCLREWHSTYLHELLLNRDYRTLDGLNLLVERLDMARRQLLHKLLTRQETNNLREAAVWDLVRGNKLLSGDIIVRSPLKKGRILTSEDSPIELNQLQASMSLMEEFDRPSHQPEVRPTFHVLVELRDVSIGVTKPTAYMLSLYTKTVGQPPQLLSESFAAEAHDKYKDGVDVFDARARCLFVDLSSADLGRASGDNTTVYLAVKAIITDTPASSTPSVKLQIPHNSNESTGAFGGLNINATWRAAAFNKTGNRRSVMFRPRSEFVSSKQDSRPETATSAAGTEGSANDSSNSDKDKSQDQTAGSQRPVRRLVSVGVLDIGPLVRAKQHAEQECYLRTPVLSSNTENEHEAKHDAVVAEIMEDLRGTNYRYDTMRSLTVRISPFVHPDSSALVTETPTLLQGVQQVQRVGFLGAPTRPRSDIFLTLKKPYLPRNVLLSHPRTGTVPLPTDVSMANLQLTLEVRSASGERIDSCIYPSANSAGHTAWRTPAVGRGDSWNQTLRLALRPEQVPGSHIVMSLADCFEFPFALCWVPLWHEDAFIADGTHSLAMYKYDEYTSNMMAGQGAYLQLPWSAKAKDESVTGPCAALLVNTTLCSTKYSSNPSLLGLLKWRENRPSEVIGVLKNFSFVPEIEIVKLLSETLDALFEIMVEYSGEEEIEDLVFFDLVSVLSIVHDRRFNLQPLVDDYANTKFQQPFAFSCLVRSFAKLLSDPAPQDNARTLRAASKVGAHIFRFIVTARRQQITKEVGIGITGQGQTIAKDMMPIFRALESLMRDPTPTLIGTKTLIVQNYHTWLPPVSSAVEPHELLALANNFVESCANVEGRLVMFKLTLLNNISALDLFNTKSTRKTWQSKMYSWLESHWGSTEKPTTQWREQIRLCGSIVATLIAASSEVDLSIFLPKILDSYQTLRKASRSDDNSFSPLFPTTYPFPTKQSVADDKYDEALIELAALLAASTSRSKVMFPDLSSQTLTQLLHNCLDVYDSILSGDAYPTKWLSTQVSNHSACLRMLQQMFIILQSQYTPVPEQAEHFETNLWRKFLTLLMKLVGSDSLALEAFSEQKRRAIWKVGGDIREGGASLLASAWESLGWDTSINEKKRFGLNKSSGYQVQYVPALVGPVLVLCLSVHESLRGAAVAMLHSMIISEGTLSDSLEVIKTEMIDYLENDFKGRRISDGMAQKLFVDELSTRMMKLGLRKDDQLYPKVRDLLQSLDQLLDLLIAMQSSEQTNEASHIVDTLEMLEFFKDMNKEHMYISYIHKLADLQSRSQNPTEAALALKLHADMYDWDPRKMVTPIGKPYYPRQSASERKEKLYFQMISLFEDGAAWDQALAAYKELAAHYENTAYDFAKLARAQRAMATIHENLAKGELHTPRYFKVFFQGLGFSPNVKDRHFIYEGSSTDKLRSFTDKLLAQFPSAQIVSGHGDVSDLEGQYLTITGVSAQKDLLHPIARRTNLPQSVKNYYLLAHPTRFTTTTRRHAATGEIADQIMEKLVFTTAEPLPTILRRSEIVAHEKIRLSPVQIGIERAMRKTQDLLALDEEVRKGNDSNLNNLTESLRLLVDGQSGGNVIGYWELVPRYMRKDKPEPGRSSDKGLTDYDKTLLEVLKASLIDHVNIIKSSLSQYSRSAHQATGAELRKMFERTFAPIITVINAAQQTEAEQTAPRSANEISRPVPAAVLPIPAVSPNMGTDATFSVGARDQITSPTFENERTMTKMSMFSQTDDSMDATPPAIGHGPKHVSKQTSSNSLQDRLGSMSKRLSSFNVGGTINLGRRALKKGTFKASLPTVAGN